MIVCELLLLFLVVVYISCMMGLGLIGFNFIKVDCGYEIVNWKYVGWIVGLVVVLKVLFGFDDNVLYYSIEGRFMKWYCYRFIKLCYFWCFCENK